jgi:hypothetical protein
MSASFFLETSRPEELKSVTVRLSQGFTSSHSAQPRMQSSFRLNSYITSTLDNCHVRDGVSHTACHSNKKLVLETFIYTWPNHVQS